MRLVELIRNVSRDYPDGMVMEFFKLNYTPTGRKKFDLSTGPKSVGDTLAAFIVSELVETFESNRSREEQIEIALRRMEVAKKEIELATNGLGGYTEFRAPHFPSSGR